MTWLIKTNKGRLTEERNTNGEASYGEKKQRLNHSVMGQRAAQNAEPRKKYNK